MKFIVRTVFVTFDILTLKLINLGDEQNSSVTECKEIVIRGESLRLVTERTFPTSCPRCYQHSVGYVRRPPRITKNF